MIPLENQVCTLEQAKIFKDEFGLELESYFVWAQIGIYKTSENYELVSRERAERTGYFYKNHISALSCAELGILLPDYISRFAVDRHYKQVRISYPDVKNNHEMSYERVITHRAEHEVHGKAGLLIDGLRKGYIKPEDLKL